MLFSTSEYIIDDLYEKMQKRGKSILVPKDCREILVCITDLSTSINQDTNVVSSLVKDLIEYKQLFKSNQDFSVKDMNLLCKLSLKDSGESLT